MATLCRCTARLLLQSCSLATPKDVGAGHVGTAVRCQVVAAEQLAPLGSRTALLPFLVQGLAAIGSVARWCDRRLL